MTQKRGERSAFGRLEGKAKVERKTVKTKRRKRRVNGTSLNESCNSATSVYFRRPRKS